MYDASSFSLQLKKWPNVANIIKRGFMTFCMKQKKNLWNLGEVEVNTLGRTGCFTLFKQNIWVLHYMV